MPPEVLPVVMYRGLRPVTLVGEVPTDEAPPTARRAIAPAEAELRADVASEAAGRSHDAGFNFDFLRLAVQLCEQAVDLGSTPGISEMISELVRSSDITSPR